MNECNRLCNSKVTLHIHVVKLSCSEPVTIRQPQPQINNTKLPKTNLSRSNRLAPLLYMFRAE